MENKDTQKPMTATKTGQQITQEHDKGYKRIFSKYRNFLHFLKKYIKNDGPADWVEDIDESDLVWINTTLIDAEFKKRESDVVYKMKFKGREIIFYILLELQSVVDYTMPFRLLRYMTLILNYVFENTPRSERELKSYRLPAIMPVILYNGADNWTAAGSFKEYQQDHEQFGKRIIDFEYYLLDVNRMDDATLLSAKELLDIVLFLDKKENRNNLEASLNTASEYFNYMSDEDKEDMLDWLRHIWLNHIADEKKKNELLEKFKRSEVLDMVSGLSLMFEEERLKGKEEAEQKAEQKAYEEKVELIKEMLLDGEPMKKIIKYSKFTEDKIKEIKETL